MPTPTKKTPPGLQYEQAHWQQGFSFVAGVDEVGRGALAGPVVTAAVVFSATHRPIFGVRDSKQLSFSKRLELYNQIRHHAVSWSVGVGTVLEINQFGIVPSLVGAVRQSLQILPKVDQVLMDGIAQQNLHEYNQRSIQFIKKGDQKSYSIAAASILAKVYRDLLMIELAKQFPDYGWDKNMGYGTSQHREAIKVLGITHHHRLLFLRKILT